MKLTSIHLSTSYPRGYGRDDPKLITGSIEIRLGADSWNSASHTLTAEALQKIAAIALEDYKANAEKIEIPGVLYYNEEDLPPVVPEPQEADPPLHIETEDGQVVDLHPIKQAE